MRLIAVLPQGALSRLVGRLSRVELPGPLQSRVNRWFARLAGVDLREAESPPEAYPSVGTFFVRRLRVGSRSWPEDPDVVSSPVDAVLGAFGQYEDRVLVQAKGRTYDLEALLGGEAVEPFRTGCFFTLYLSPRHYHRVHAPASGRILTARAIPGRLFPVNQAAVSSIRDLFPRNERLVAVMETERHRIAVVAVGALNVGSISADFDPDWGDPARAAVTNLGKRGRGGGLRRVYHPPVRVARGDELMAFHLGSTVVLIVAGEQDVPVPESDLVKGEDVRLGHPLVRP